MRRTAILAALLLPAGSGWGAPLYLDPSVPIARRVDDLIARMTPAEKISQLNNDARPIPRLKVPGYNYWNEALHGVARDGIATVYPQSIGIAATFDIPLVRSMGTDIASEARAKYQLALRNGDAKIFQGITFFSPNINIFRDPRWGRGQETYGEDPFLTAQVGVAFITGMQGPDPRHLVVSTTAKHFAVHSGPEPLRHGFDAKASAHDLADTYLPAFRAAVVEGHVASVMCVYNAVNGIPGCASSFLLQQTLRDSWGFKGFVVSDCNAVNDIHTGHHYVDSEPAAAAAALKAGMDNECTVKSGPHEEDYAKYADALRQGLITQAQVDEAVRRAFTVRFELGMFDPPDAARMVPASAVDSAAHRRRALQVARESMVLLKNNGILPLTKAPARIAVIGPLADSVRMLEGNYNGTPSRVTTIVDGLRQQFPTSQIVFEQGTAQFLREPIPVPSSALSTDDGQPGLTLQYFDTADHRGQALLTRVTPGVSLDSRGDAGTKFAHWHGWLTPTQSGDYTLGVPGGRNQLQVDGKPLVDGRPHADSLPGFATLHLEAGHRYAITIDNPPSGARSVRLVWTRKDPQAAARAVEVARHADLVIAVVGITADLEGEESSLSIPGFKGGDRTSLDLPAEEEQLVESVQGVGKPLVVVLVSGSGLAVNWIQDHADAVLQAWYPGEEGGAAVAQTLAGRNNPAGRLPVTFYRGLEGLPEFTDYSMKNRTYRYFRGPVLYPFGYGLSYSTFRYDNLQLSSATLAAGKPLAVQVRVTNTSARAGDEVAQVYLQFGGAAGAPGRALRAFERLHLRAGESRTVHFALSPRQLSHVDDAGQVVIGAGRYELSVGSGQPQLTPDVISAPLSIQGDVRLAN
ncbi:MAG TPA: glycoside hydrolase family 3 C-terminal domain-containing protein [Steroidobacteraceae bacterium]|nr:glycoside hydrolase family 3 C-terminal domain-containing protein [Steroidobacteraceae bacterium]